MPEGDSVWRSCAKLHKALAGRKLTRAELRVPQVASVRLAGHTVDEVKSYGKHQLIRISNGLTLHTHLRMDGTWRVVPASTYTPGPAHQLRVLLQNAEVKAAGLRLGMVDVVRTKDESRIIGHLGPDLLDPSWNEELRSEAVRRLASHPATTIGEALLDQRNLAGIGTIYRAETLFWQGINPRTPVRHVEDLDAVVQRAHDLLYASITGDGRSTTGMPGLDRWVYGRGGRPCARCRTPIAVVEYGPYAEERLSYWCPTCQPAVTTSG